MLSFTLTDRNNFTSHLLLQDTFDHFQLIEGEIVTFGTFHVDGLIQKEYFDSDAPLPLYSPWKNMRPLCLSLVKGSRAPLRFRFIFTLPSRSIEAVIRKNELAVDPAAVQGLYLNIRYDGARLSCVTGTSFKTFTPDKSLERLWDEMVKNFLLQKDIAFEPDL